MGNPEMARYSKTITIRCTPEQYGRWRNYCMNNGIALNELTRFALDKATLGDVYAEKLVEEYAKRM